MPVPQEGRKLEFAPLFLWLHLKRPPEELMETHKTEPAKETARLVALVEQETGYRVTVGTTNNSKADAEMISAAPGHPVHLINVSTRCLPVADYIVAVQCVMLLTMWSHPKGVPVFEIIPEKIEYAIRKAACCRGLAKLPQALSEQTARNMVLGMLHQLISTPPELIAMEYCHRECPGLRGQQADALAQSLRRNTGNLRAEIKEMAPPEIWTANQTLCASLARGWCDLVEDEIAMLPYNSVGVEDTAQKLLGIYRSVRGTMGERSVGTVDRWADELRLRSLYAWTFRKKTA